MNVQLLIIDPQVDFCSPDGALSVPGADEDIKRLAGLVRANKDRLDDIHVTMDSHQVLHIAHPTWWVDRDGNHPAPFTQINLTDIESGQWTTKRPGLLKRSREYVETLEKNQRYTLTIWPEHCIIGTRGHGIMPELSDALREWCVERFANVDYVTKGSNPYTEHYSALRADVMDPSDPGTQLNTKLVDTLLQADALAITGQAITHCVANTVRDLAEAFRDDSLVKKLILITDTCSPVPGFENLGDQFIKEMTARGMQTCKAADFFKSAPVLV